MQANCKTEKPQFRSWCFGVTKAVPIAALSLGAIFAASPTQAQTLPGVYTNSWLGNTYGLPADHIAHNIDNLYVTPSGKVATITSWDEGGTNAALYSSSGGIIGVPVSSGTQANVRGSGSAIFADDNFLYQAMTETGILSGCVRRYNHDGSAAPFTGGKGYDGSMLAVTDGYPPTGVVVYNNELYASDLNAKQVKVYNASTMSQTPVRSFAIANVGLMDYDRQGYIWMLDTVQKKLIRFSSTGAIQSQSISFPSGVVPTGFCVDKVNDRILVTNKGNDQNVLIYTNIFSTPSQTSTFGNTGGINSGVAGAIAPLKFSEPKGVGIDSAGNIFIGNNGISGGGRLEKYNSSGSLQWRLNGNVFTANGDLNPADETEFYTHDHKFKLNLNNTTPGSEWSFAAQTVNKVKYPGDIRIPPAPGTTYSGPYGEFWTNGYTRVVQGKKILFIENMYGSNFGIYRFNAATDGEIAIPSGWMTKLANIWRDANGNGRQDSGELETFGVQESTDGCFFYPDSNGGVWKTNKPGTGVPSLRYFPMQGFDAYGNPQYSYASSVGYTLPELAAFIRVEYDAANDVLYATGLSTSMIDMGSQWGAAGDKMVRYNNFRNNSTRSVAWTKDLPFSNTGPANVFNVKAIAEAGDYLFLAAVLNGRIYIYKKSDGSKVGEILPGATTGYTSGWSDIVSAIRATKRSNGEYLIFAEENGNGKIMMYRWNPTPPAVPTIRARFYPVAGYETRMVGGKFQGSSDNSSWTDLGTTSGPNQEAWTDLALSSVDYRYLRYLAPANSYGNVAEIEFYNGSTKITGTKFGTAGSYNNGSGTYDKAMDGDTTTFFNAAEANKSGAYVGIDRGSTYTPPTPTTGTITRDVWTGISGTAVSAIPVTTTPSSTGTLTSFEAPTNVADNYGQRVRGYLTAPTNGSYTFWIAGDDNCELYLTTNGQKTKIAYHTDWTNSREWNKFATQKSAAISLTAGQQYYVEALMKEGGGGDNLAVGWAKPGQSTTAPSEVIPGNVLSPTPAAVSLGDASFESQTSTTLSSPWSRDTSNGLAGIDFNAGKARSGSNNAWLYNTVAGQWCALTQTVSVQPNTTYTFKAYVTASTNIGQNLWIGIRNTGGGNKRESILTPSSSGYTQLSSPTYTTGATETQVNVYVGYDSPVGSSWIQVDDTTLN